MAQLNLTTRKSFSEQNMRKIINILVGLMSSVSALEDQCIKEYDNTGNTTYSKGQIVIGSDGYFYEAKTVASGVFDSSKWTKIGTDNFTELYLDTIKSYLNLSSEDIAKLSDILLDTEVRLDKGWSSSCIYSKLQQCLDDSKAYTLKELSKLSGASYKVVASTSEMTSESIIYLLPNATNYDMYIVEADGTARRIGDTTINLDNYFTKQEISDNYYDKSTSDGKFATITTVDAHINDTVAHMTQNEKDKLDTIPTDDEIKDLIKNNENKVTLHHTGTESVFDFIDTNCTEGYRTYWIKFESTATDIPCDYGLCEIIVDSPSWIKVIAYDVVSKNNYIAMKENGVWNKTWTKILTNTDITEKYKIKDYNNDLKVNNTITKLEDLLKLVPSGETWYIPDFNIDQTATDFGFPEEMRAWGSITITNSISNGHYLIELQTNNNYQFYKRWLGETKNGTAGTNSAYQVNWQKVCTTSVADVGKTFVPFTVPSSITVYNPDRPDLFGLYYIVKNGVCYVDVTMSLASISQMNNFTTLCSGMPKPAISYVRNEINSWNDKTAPTIAMAINGGESAFLIVAHNMSTSPMTPSNSDGHFGYFCSFSYPVAE